MKDVMNEVFLGLGGNQGDRWANLLKSTEAIERECGDIILRSSVYETEGWGLDTGLKFLNQVIKIESNLNAENLLKKLLTIEQSLGRQRNKQGYSDRTVDLDILFFNKEQILTEILQIPHPRLHLRKFILVPMNEIAPDFMHPVLQKSIQYLLQQCEDTLAVTKYEHSDKFLKRRLNHDPT